MCYVKLFSSHQSRNITTPSKLLAESHLNQDQKVRFKSTPQKKFEVRNVFRGKVLYIVSWVIFPKSFDLGGSSTRPKPQPMRYPQQKRSLRAGKDLLSWTQLTQPLLMLRAHDVTEEMDSVFSLSHRDFQNILMKSISQQQFNFFHPPKSDQWDCTVPFKTERILNTQLIGSSFLVSFKRLFGDRSQTKMPQTPKTSNSTLGRSFSEANSPNSYHDLTTQGSAAQVLTAWEI